MGLVAVHSGAGNAVNEENYRVLCKKSARIACNLLDAGEFWPISGLFLF